MGAGSTAPRRVSRGIEQRDEASTAVESSYEEERTGQRYADRKVLKGNIPRSRLRRFYHVPDGAITARTKVHSQADDDVHSEARLRP